MTTEVRLTGHAPTDIHTKGIHYLSNGDLDPIPERSREGISLLMRGGDDLPIIECSRAGVVANRLIFVVLVSLGSWVALDNKQLKDVVKVINDRRI
jgi:hypothetical protein